MVTTTLPSKCGKGDTFKILTGSIFRKEQSYELEKSHSRWLRSSVRFRSLDCDGSDERTRWFDGRGGNPRRWHATFDGRDANASRSHDEFTRGPGTFWGSKLQSIQSVCSVQSLRSISSIQPFQQVQPLQPLQPC